MSIGQLRKRCYFERQKKRVDDGGGGYEPVWLPAMTVWGAVVPYGGAERLAAGRLEASSLATLRIRSSAEARSIDESYRVTVDDVPYQIRGIANPDSRNRFLEIQIEGGVAI